MLDSLRYVRPVISLDATQIKTTSGGGTLYMASAKSASNDIYPVAISLMIDNQNKDGWLWFLAHLKSCLPLLDQEEHPKEGVPYKRFTFISDRQKGLIEALKEVFPCNHSCFCATHIARNVESRFGAKQGKYVVPLAKTFSSSYAEDLLQSMSEEARNYVEQIEAAHWRSTTWLDDEALPPRFGIVTSNGSEWAISALEQAREVPSMSSLQILLSKMVEQIASLSEKYKHKSGVVDDVLKNLKHSWQSCEGMWIVAIMNDDADVNDDDARGDIVTVFEPPAWGALSEESSTGFKVNLALQTCDCGLWQEHGYPCIHAVAFFKKHHHYSFDDLLGKVNKEYTYESDLQLFQRNFWTVCMDTIAPNKSSLMPRFQKRKSGGTKEKRIRKRPRLTMKTPMRNTRCSRCGVPGHNARTCVARRVEGEEDRHVGV